MLFLLNNLSFTFVIRRDTSCLTCYLSTNYSYKVFHFRTDRLGVRGLNKRKWIIWEKSSCRAGDETDECHKIYGVWEGVKSARIFHPISSFHFITCSQKRFDQNRQCFRVTPLNREEKGKWNESKLNGPESTSGSSWTSWCTSVRLFIR